MAWHGQKNIVLVGNAVLIIMMIRLQVRHNAGASNQVGLSNAPGSLMYVLVLNGFVQWLTQLELIKLLPLLAEAVYIKEHHTAAGSHVSKHSSRL